MLLLSGLQGLCSPKEGSSHPCEHEVYQETKIVDLAEPLTQPRTGATGFGSPALMLPGPTGAKCQVFAAYMK